MFIVINASIVEHVDGLKPPVKPSATYKKIKDTFDTQKPLAQKPIYTDSFSLLMKTIEVPETEWSYMHYILYQESGFCMFKWEGQRECPSEYKPLYSPSEHVGYGLCQATPAIKYSEEGNDWQSNMYTQARWCYKYAKKYGSLANAVAFKQCLGSCYSSRTNSIVYKKTIWF